MRYQAFMNEQGSWEVWDIIRNVMIFGPILKKETAVRRCTMLNKNT